MTKKIENVLLLAVIALVVSCNSDSKSLEEQLQTTDTATVAPTLDISEQTLNDIIQSIPSPIEISSLIKESGAVYDNTILNPTDNMDKYTTANKKALNIGVYSADLGYLNIYDKSYASLEYLNSIGTLAEEINIGQFFNFELLKKLASNNKNMDSLLYISTSSFNKMDIYLREHKRGGLSILMISGGWLEGLHIASQVAKATPTKEIVERVGEQKINLDNIMVIVTAYKGDPYFTKLAAELSKLKKIYDNVTITYEYKEPETKEVNGQLVVESKSTSTINMTDAQLKEIIATTEQIRKTLLE